VTTGVYAGSAAVGGPLLGRLADRGQRTRVLIATSSLSAALLWAIALAPSAMPLAILLALSGCLGAATPPVSACLHSALPTFARDAEQVQTLYAFDTTLIELTWVCGPPLVLGVGVVWSTGAALGLAGTLLFGSTLAFAICARAAHPM